MIFNEHSNLEGLHSILSPSSYRWLNYTPEKLADYYISCKAAERGTKMHDFAKRCIELGQKLPKSRKTLNMYVNDAIGFKMKPEQVLFYSSNCFGTADAISFNKNFLRIHDYKTGVVKASFHQLEIYMAIFCLEYKIDPYKIGSELRIYQNDEAISYIPDPAIIIDVMNLIVDFDQRIEIMKMEE